MALTEAEQRFLAVQRHGRLATIAPGGSPQVKPVGFTYNTELGTIDIAGFNMAGSAKYRNIRANPQVAFVVDEVRFSGINGVSFLEIRGGAEAVSGQVPADPQWQAEGRGAGRGSPAYARRAGRTTGGGLRRAGGP